MQKVGKFGKVSLPEYTKQMKSQFGSQFSDEEIAEQYEKHQTAQALHQRKRRV